MPLGSSSSQTLRNPFAPGGAMYGVNSTDAYQNASSINGFPLGNSGNPRLANPYAPGGANWGQMGSGAGPQTAQNNNTQRQIDAAYWGQKAREQQQQYQGPAAGGAFRGGNPLSGILDQIAKQIGGGGAGGGGGGVNYTSGITAGPVYTPQQVQQGTAQIGQYGKSSTAAPLNMGPRGMVPPEMQNALQTQLTDATRAGTTAAQTEFTRDAAYANAQQQLASEQARAGSGVQLANLGVQMQGFNQDALLRLLRQLTGMIS